VILVAAVSIRLVTILVLAVSIRLVTILVLAVSIRLVTILVLAVSIRLVTVLVLVIHPVIRRRGTCLRVRRALGNPLQRLLELVGRALVSVGFAPGDDFVRVRGQGGAAGLGMRLAPVRAVDDLVAVLGVGCRSRGGGGRIRQYDGRSVVITRIVVGKGERGDEAQQRTRNKNKNT
jgi:hypothetical protein